LGNYYIVNNAGSHYKLLYNIFLLYGLFPSMPAAELFMLFSLCNFVHEKLQ